MAVKKLVLGLLLRVLIAPVWVIGVLGMLVIYPFWGARLQWDRGVLFLHCRPDSWFSKSQWAGQCWGHGIILSSQATEQTIRHELIHTEQIEAGAVSGLFVALCMLPVFAALVPIGSAFALATLIWAALPYVAYGSGAIVALLRGKDGYRGNHAEEAARNGVH